MRDEPPAHRWLRPKLTMLLAESESAGIARDVAVAVLMDLLAGPDFNPPMLNEEPERGQAASVGYRDATITED